YPTLTKLLTYPTQFFLQNIKTFLQHITHHKQKISKLFYFNPTCQITPIQIPPPHSHQQPKTLILFTLHQHLQLLYKPKNLQIPQKYHHFFNSFQTKQPPFQLLLSNKILTPPYPIHHSIPYKPSTSNKQLHQFYTPFPYFLPISYFLRRTHLHFQNFIPHAQYPVLIHLQTLFQHQLPL
ncbi:DUF4135 domain-containing protein, partial [Bacillus thuringiensis]|uniref:DUF4135 domain-containing protein n=1 Tax=Bacillus thuringiensis TaxID=1428 RepID=UPI0011A6DCB8